MPDSTTAPDTVTDPGAPETAPATRTTGRASDVLDMLVEEPAPAAPVDEKGEKFLGIPVGKTPEGETPEESGVFDPAAFAKEHGIDETLVKGAKSERDVIARLSKRLKNQQQLMGRQAQEVAEARRALSERKPPETPAAAPAPAPAEQPDQFDQFIAWHASNPTAANQWYQEWVDREPVSAQLWFSNNMAKRGMKGALEPVTKRLEEMGSGIKAAAEAPRRAAFEAERVSFIHAHPDFDGDGPDGDLLEAVADDLGIKDWADAKRPAVEDVYALSKLKPADDDGDAEPYNYVLTLMKRGFKFSEAKHYLDLEQQAAGAEARTEAVVQAARAAAPAPMRAAPAKPPAATKPVRRVGDFLRQME